ncbi:T9SS type A sorting domain-containing protein [Winogradskyella eckloniae]|uniref:GEVED domain-containing protein n=1 Tax=Winogradskyella eckloniae TaxID=1089306 RepID=UPI00156710B3|nr:GEVED domain-containing protein [Winogradskyella eckloniae]NRD20088.1 T9SS type A sorting domain-containing protein [Winogradskyella eckloniae]
MRLSKTIFTVIIAISLASITYAQEKCATDIKRQELLLDPNFVELERLAEERAKEALKNRNLSKMTNVLTIPVVIHVLHLGEAEGVGSNISDAQIYSSIDNLNDYYRGQIPTSSVDFEIEFVLAQRDPNCNSTDGIIRLDASSLPGYSNFGVNVANTNGADYSDIVAFSSWPKNEYFNIWIVTELDNNNGGYGYQGYAYYYGENYTNHGSVMMSSVFGYDPGNTNGWGLNSNGDNSTVVHEAGHYLNLHHTFIGDGIGNDCPLDAVVGVDSDGCADTVPHKRETSTCPVINSCTGLPWVDNNTINNIMGYYSCSDRLTNDQKTRARAIMEGTPIVNSTGAEPLDPNYIEPTAACSVNSSPSVYSGILSVELNGNTEASSHSQNDGGNIDLAACSNSFIIDTSVSNTLNVEMYTNNFQQLGVWIDWNNDGDFEDNAEFQHFSQDISPATIVPITLTYPTIIPYGNYVRMRLITDVDDIYGPGLINNSPCYSSLAYGQSEDYSIYVEANSFTTYTYNNGWSPTNPVGVSNITDALIIESGTANINANTTCSNVTVNPGAALTIDLGVTLSASLVTLNSTSQQFSSLISDGSITGLVNYNRHVALVGSEIGGTNDLISAPISGILFPDFATVNLLNLPALGAIRAFAPYNTVDGEYQNYNIITNLLTTIDPGIGYRTATTDGGTLSFSGTPIISDVLDVPITDAGAGFAWNLIGNPYPSYIDFEDFFTENSNEFAVGTAYKAIYGYDGNTQDGWTVWNLATIANTTITELIAPGQGFYVKSKSGGGLVDFTTSMRRTGSTDDFIAGRNTTTNVAFCKLNLTSNTKTTSTEMYFIEGTTRGLDSGYDAALYKGNASPFCIFSNLVENDEGLGMAIQSLPYSALNNTIIPIGIHAIANEQLTLSIDDSANLPSDIQVFLNDTYENTITLLNDSDYIFTPSQDLSGIGRFYIQYETQALDIKDNDINSLIISTTATPKTIIVEGLLMSNTKAYLYDLQGRLVLTEALNISNTFNYIDVSSLSTGVYIIKVSNTSNSKFQKLILK